MGNEQTNPDSKHGVKDGTVLDEKSTKALGKTVNRLPKFMPKAKNDISMTTKLLISNQSTPLNIEMEKITVPFEPHKDKFCIVIRNAFTKKECNELIKMSEKQKYGPAYVRTRDNYMKGQQLNLEGRNNSRVMIDSREMADFFFKRIETFIPMQWRKQRVVALNERLRFLRYHRGEYFKMHMDGPYKRDNGEESFVTFLLYLNEGFKGGSTTLFDLNDETNNKAVVPETGMVLLFQHDIWHDGEEVVKGTKYCIRTDVMYEANAYHKSKNKKRAEDEKESATK
eukprot:185057_1